MTEVRGEPGTSKLFESKVKLGELSVTTEWIQEILQKLKDGSVTLLPVTLEPKEGMQLVNIVRSP